MLANLLQASGFRVPMVSLPSLEGLVSLTSLEGFTSQGISIIATPISLFEAFFLEGYAVLCPFLVASLAGQGGSVCVPPLFHAQIWLVGADFGGTGAPKKSGGVPLNWGGTGQVVWEEGGPSKVGAVGSMVGRGT